MFDLDNVKHLLCNEFGDIKDYISNMLLYDFLGKELLPIYIAHYKYGYTSSLDSIVFKNDSNVERVELALSYSIGETDQEVCNHIVLFMNKYKDVIGNFPYQVIISIDNLAEKKYGILGVG
jgi:hypothetical protein